MRFIWRHMGTKAESFSLYSCAAAAAANDNDDDDDNNNGDDDDGNGRMLWVEWLLLLLFVRSTIHLLPHCTHSVLLWMKCHRLFVHMCAFLALCSPPFQFQLFFGFCYFDFVQYWITVLVTSGDSNRAREREGEREMDRKKIYRSQQKFVVCNCKLQTL